MIQNVTDCTQILSVEPHHNIYCRVPAAVVHLPVKQEHVHNYIAEVYSGSLSRVTVVVHMPVKQEHVHNYIAEVDPGFFTRV